MTSYDHAFKYFRPVVILHWLMFLLLIVVYAAMEFRVFFEKSMP
jgi:cytochrome b561